MKKLIRFGVGQSLFDICLQYYGSVEGIRFILEDNPNIELEANLMAVYIRPELVIDQKTKNFFKNKPPSSL